jgi:drug/metabolite transporter (DMT)-like permease
MNLTNESPDITRLLGFAALGLVIVGNATGNLLLKLGAGVKDPGQLFFGVFAWQTLAGIASFGSGVLVYAWALKQFDLHSAQIVTSVQFVLAILLAALVLGERIAPAQWIGIGFIAVGLFLCVGLR